jgi:hypothetical protein
MLGSACFHTLVCDLNHQWSGYANGRDWFAIPREARNLVLPLKPRFVATLGMTLFRVLEDSGFRVMFPQYEQGWIGPDSLGLTSSSDPLITQDWPPRYAC